MLAGGGGGGRLRNRLPGRRAPHKIISATGNFCLSLFCMELRTIILSNSLTQVLYSNTHSHAPRRSPFCIFAIPTPANAAGRNRPRAPHQRHRATPLGRPVAPALRSAINPLASCLSLVFFFELLPLRPSSAAPRFARDLPPPVVLASTAIAATASSVAALYAAAPSTGSLLPCPFSPPSRPPTRRPGNGPQHPAAATAPSHESSALLSPPRALRNLPVSPALVPLLRHPENASPRNVASAARTRLGGG